MATPIGRCKSTAVPSAMVMQPSELWSGCWSRFIFKQRRHDEMSRFMTSRTAKDAIGIAALLVAAALVGGHCARRMLLPEAPRDPKHTAGADFRDVIYYPTRAMLAGVNPY